MLALKIGEEFGVEMLITLFGIQVLIRWRGLDGCHLEQISAPFPN